MICHVVAIVLLGLGAKRSGATVPPRRVPEPADLYDMRQPSDEPLLYESWTGFDSTGTLREAAAKAGIYIGAAANYHHLQNTSDSEYSQTAASEFDLYTAENGCKFAPTEPQRGSYSYTQCDYVYSRASKSNTAFRGHNLCWGNYNPSWLNDTLLNASALEAVLKNHVTTVMQHYGRDHLVCWDVVNEAVADSGASTFKPTVWFPALPNYVDIAFQAARAAEESVKLFYNDYGAEGMNVKSDKIYDMVKSMKSRGVPVDGVGLQMHVSTNHYPKFADVASNIARLGALGLDVHITEMDVKCEAPCDLKVQAHVYAGMLKACLSNKACKSFETWGVTDRYTWVGSNSKPLLFDFDYGKKPAYLEVLATLQNHMRA